MHFLLVQLYNDKVVLICNTHEKLALFCAPYLGDVAVKILKVKDPTPEQFQAFRNEVAVLRWETWGDISPLIMQIRKLFVWD